jgi:diguanylate cyclase (GGDEF)-like protein/PAS domain S-box-containing protein
MREIKNYISIQKLLIVFFVFSMTLNASQKTTNEKISLQLKWFSSFQFAGYYMALEKGYYSDVGLDVNIIERDPSKNNIDQVINGEADYGVADSSLLLYRARGKAVQIMASFFQHSPLVFISKKGSGIVSPFELKGKILSFQEGIDDAPLLAMMLDSKISENDYIYKPLDFTAQEFIDGKVDVISAYLGDQPYFLKEKGIEVNIINPLNYGIDLYGDNLFSTEKTLNKNPIQAKKFLNASIRGWKYALEHKEETAKILKEKYAAKSSLNHLLYEADSIEKMMIPSLIELGYTSVERFYRISEIYEYINKASKESLKVALKDLIWNSDRYKNGYLHYVDILFGVLFLFLIIITALFLISRRLKKIIEEKTSRLKEEHLMVDRYVIITTTDIKGNITYASEAFCNISGYKSNEVIKKKFTQICNKNMQDSFYEQLWNKISQRKIWKGEIKNSKKDGTYYWVYMIIEPIINNFNEHIGYRAIYQDITDKKLAQNLAITDNLTKLYNRTHLESVLKQQMAQSNRYNKYMCVVLLDIDLFKNINDNYGHQVGDIVLKEISSILQNNIRKTDTLGRWGGEEFLIITPNINAEQCYLLCEKLRVAVEAYVFENQNSVTISIGIAEFILNENSDSFIERADKAMYSSKENGRNQINIA